MKQFIIVPLLLASLVLFGQNQNLSNGNVFDGEPYLAINPNNSSHLVIAWMGWVNFANQFKIKTKASFDGGSTWSTTVELPHTIASYSSADPCIAIHSNGDVYLSYIDFTGTTPPVTGGVYLCKSSDGGFSWEAPKEVISTNHDGTNWPIDRPWLVIDKSSGPNQGNIYVTTFPLNRTQASFHPYLSVSSDEGNTFSTKYLDTIGWLAGNLNPFPMCSPAISSSGVFYGVYPSFLFAQSQYFQSFLVTTDNGGVELDHKHVLTQPTPASSITYPNAKKGGLLLCDPGDETHLAYLFLGADYGDLDVFVTETDDAGTTWSSPIRVNDDPIGNHRMQDLIWGDFDQDGDLVVSWRDRRNGTDSSYQTASEIWASHRQKDSINFSPNFQITTETVAFDSILENAGNDFMCMKLQNDTLYAAWGDPRDGRLNIWFQKMTPNGTVLSSQQVTPPHAFQLDIYPNPTASDIQIIGKHINRIRIYDSAGKIVLSQTYEPRREKIEMSLSGFPEGTYLLQVRTSAGMRSKTIVKHP